MGADRAPVMRLRLAAFVAFLTGAALIDCGGTIITRDREPRDDAGAGAASGMFGMAGSGGANFQTGGNSQRGGRAGFGQASGGRASVVDASIGGSSSGGAAGASAGGSNSADAGQCDCPPGFQCLSTPQGSECVVSCPDSVPTACNGQCTTLQSDLLNCGACGVDCRHQGPVDSTCENGECRPYSCAPGYANCTDAPGCETRLDEQKNCGACGNEMCSYDHATAGCTVERGCAAPTCEAGWANCDKSPPDCETPIGANGATCFPPYDNSASVLIPPEGPTYYTGTLAGDGTLFVGGQFAGTFDFDPGPGTDTKDVGDNPGAFVTKFGADGKYAWTRAFANTGDNFVTTLSAGPSGTVIVGGSYRGTVDLDPGTGVDAHTPPGETDGYVLKLLADGSLAWARTFVGAFGASATVQLSSVGQNGSVLLSVTHVGTVDMDPGPDQSLVTGADGPNFVALLTSSGDLGWAYRAPSCAQSTLVALGPDGSARVAGPFTGPCSFNPAENAEVKPLGVDAYLASFASNGTYEGVKTFGGIDATVEPTSLTVGPDGSVFLGGSFTGKVDFDPSPGKAEHVSLEPIITTGFLLATTPDERFAWVHTLPNGIVAAIAPIPGGVAAVTGNYNVTGGDASRILGFGNDGTSTWTLGFPGQNPVSLIFIAADTTGFSVLGLFDGSADLDPGPGTHVFGHDGESAFFTSRYGF